MPIYEYKCNNCGNQFELLVPRVEDKPRACPKCASDSTEKLMSVIGGISMGRSADTPCGATGCPSAGSCSSAGACPHMT